MIRELIRGDKVFLGMGLEMMDEFWKYCDVRRWRPILERRGEEIWLVFINGEPEVVWAVGGGKTLEEVIRKVLCILP